MNSVPSASDIHAAHNRIKAFIHLTPVLTSQTLDALTDCEVVLKCENFQKTGAFKFRGASNAVLSLSDDEIIKGVATHSSGNHAAALSLAASLRKCDANIVMPENSSRVKVEAVKNYGGKITFCKPNLQSREETLCKVIAETGAVEIHPYNNYRIIAGQATVAKELIEQVDDHLDYIIAPVGGGGLLSGTSLSVRYFSPGTLVIAAEPEMANDAWQSFMQKRLIPVNNPQTMADGLRTSLGSLTFPIICENVHSIFTVSEESIKKAMLFVWEYMKIIIEPSSAVAVAALFENKNFFSGKKVGIIISGGNVDLRNISF
ncbi:MAG: pyridoxal-phosphate dependent enzyme [Lentimicrobiaceae bacterium]|nr:pyridoxal-phosphate dependent enzyme [Lentimicrobiaceae bacterium]